MADNITQELEGFEVLVRDGEIASFWVSVRSHGLRIQAEQGTAERMVLLGGDMCESLHTFFYGIDKIQYLSHDYSNLKSFINARLMLDRIIRQDGI